MANNDYRKPSVEEFRRVIRELGGNLSKVAEFFKVTRGTVYNWRDNDPEFMNVIKDERTRLFDEALSTARVVALGVPKYDFEYDAMGEPVLDVSGRPIKRMVGWSVPPDANMLRFFMQQYGKYDKFGYDDEEAGDVPLVKNGININNWLELRNSEEPKKRGRKKKKK